MAARRALEVKWSKGAGRRLRFRAARWKRLRQGARRPGGEDADARPKGDAKSAFAGAAKTYKAEYRSDYGYHAQMEPLNAVARLNEAGDTSRSGKARRIPAARAKRSRKALGFKPEQVTLHQCYMGGGFGRRSLGDYAAEAALIAQRGEAAGEAGVDARGGHRARHVPAAGLPVPAGGAGQATARSPAGRTAWSATAACCCTTGITIPSTTACPTSYIEAARHAARHPRQALARASATCSTSSPSSRSSTRWRSTQSMDPIEFRLERMNATPKARAVFEKVARDVATGERRGPKAARSASR